MPSGSGFKRLDNVQNGVTHTGADVVRLHPGDGTGTVQRHEMRPRQIYHVDIVADTGAVMGLVIIPVDVQIRALALRHLRDVGEQVVGNPLRILADEPRRMRADRVEVPQERNTPRGIRPVQIAQNALNHLFGLTVWVGCFSQPVGFPDRDALRRAVHRCGRTEYQFPHTVTAHGIAQVKCGKQVVPVVAERLTHRLAHRLEPGKMNAAFNIGVLGKQPLGRVGVGQLHLHKSRGLPGNLPDAIQYDRLAVDKVIRDNQVLSPFQKLHRIR